MKKLTLDDFALFVDVAAEQSLSQVARNRQVAASRISRHFSRIEAQCHLRLAHRTTHSLSLTDDGEVFLEYAQRIVSEHAQLDANLTTRAKAVAGTIRISVSQLLGHYVVVPRLAELRALHPNLCLDLLMDDKLADIAHEGIDIAVRAGVAPQDGVIARDLGRHGRALYAAPAYLKKYGAPQHPGDLSKHCLITNTAVAAHNSWQFVMNGKTENEVVRGQLRVNNSAAVLSLALAGAGIGHINSVVAASLVAVGQLQPVLARNTSPEQYPVYAAILAERHRAPKIRAATDFLSLCFAAFKPGKVD